MKIFIQILLLGFHIYPFFSVIFVIKIIIIKHSRLNLLDKFLRQLKGTLIAFHVTFI